MPSDIDTDASDVRSTDKPRDAGEDSWLFHALQYADLGWRITPWRNPEPGVHDPPEGWQGKATSDPDELRQLRESYPSKSNLAVRLGPETNVLVLDADRHEDGEDGLQTLSELQEKLGKLPTTARVRTGGGGLHFYFRWIDFGKAAQDRIAPGLDLKAGTADKGAAGILPPSIRPKHDGEPYRWLNDPEDVGVAELPEAWEEWIRERLGEDRAPTSTDGFSLPATIPEGRRNSTLARFAGRLRSRGFGEEDLLKSLHVVNQERCQPPLSESEVASIADSISSYQPGTDTEIREDVEDYALTFEPDPGELIGVLTVEHGDDVLHVDRLNITSQQRRKAVAGGIRDAVTGVDQDRLVSALTSMAGSLLKRRREAERQEEIERVSEEMEDGPDYSEETKERADSLLQSPDLVEKAAKLMSARGLVGEDANRRVVFLSAVAGHLGLPIHLVVHGESSGGKNELVGRATELLPDGRVLNFSGLSTHALEYRGGRIEGVLVLDEAEGQQDATYELRQAMSEGRVRRLTVNKTEAGQMESQELEVEVDASIITTTTTPQLHPENQTRVFDLWIDSSEDQTSSVLEEKARRATGNGASEAAEKGLRIWRCALQKLEPREVVVPFADRLAEAFPTGKVRARRDFDRVLDLLRARALLHQRQREESGGDRVVATIEDYAAVRPLVLAVLGPSMAGLNETAIEIARVLEEIGGDQTYKKRTELQRKCQGRGVASHNTVKKWTERLKNAGIVDTHQQGGRNAWHVKLVRDPETDPVDLPEAEELR